MYWERGVVLRTVTLTVGSELCTNIITKSCAVFLGSESRSTFLETTDDREAHITRKRDRGWIGHAHNYFLGNTRRWWYAVSAVLAAVEQPAGDRLGLLLADDLL